MENSGEISSRNIGTGDEVSSRAVVRETDVSLSYPLLKHNCNTYVNHLKVCLKAQGVWDAVVSENSDEKKDQMALAAILQGVPDETLLLLGEKETTKQVWDTLKTTFAGAYHQSNGGDYGSSRGVYQPSEAEYIAVSTAACQGVWLTRLLADLRMKEPQKFKLLVDNKSAISLCKNPVHHDRSKHIDTRYLYIRECIDSGKMEVEHIRTQDQVADIQTNALGRTKFHELKAKLGMQKIDKLD